MKLRRSTEGLAGGKDLFPGASSPPDAAAGTVGRLARDSSAGLGRGALDRIDEVRARAGKDGYAIIRGAVGEDQVRRLVDRTRQLFDPGADLRVSGEYRRSMQDFHRLDLGEYGASTRFARYFMFFPWNRDPVFESVSATMMEIMRRLAGKNANYASAEDTNPDRFRISYVIQYPSGGGFMSKHREYTRQEDDDHAYVLSLALTTRSKDFSSGGAYLFRGDERLDLEVPRGVTALLRRHVPRRRRDRPRQARCGEVCGAWCSTRQVIRWTRACRNQGR